MNSNEPDAAKTAPAELTAASAVPELETGTCLGPYEIVGLIGAGGMAEVYRARDPRLGREVAIKVLPSALSTDRDRLRRFEQEARAVAALNHPNIVAIHDIGTHGEAPYVVMELLEGVTVRAGCVAERYRWQRHSLGPGTWRRGWRPHRQRASSTGT